MSYIAIIFFCLFIGSTVAAFAHTHVEADITDLQAYLLNIQSEPLSDLSDVTLTSIADGELLRWNGSGWINNTLAEAGIAAAVHTHAAADVTVGTFADARISQSSVTQHQAALTITESQISDLTHTDAYTKTESDAAAGTTGAKINKVSGAAAGDVATMTAGGEVASSGTQLSALAPLASPTFTGVPVLPTYTLGTLPSHAAGGLIYVSDANAAAGAIAYSDGTTWKDVGTNVAVV